MSIFKRFLAPTTGAVQRILGGIRTGGGPVNAETVVGGDYVNQYLSPIQATVPRQLPKPTADFVGRETELSKIEETIMAGKPAGIFGLGGTGKTELALSVANRVATKFPDAQLMLDLNGWTKQPMKAYDALFNAVLALQALPPGEKQVDLQELRQFYLSGLSGKRALVVLDNCAKLDQILPLLPPAGCGLIVTARKPIGVPGLVPLLLDELPREDAVKLFGDIARNVDSEIAEQICSLCGFLPLAIRACATRLAYSPDLEPRDYCAQLRDERTRLKMIANSEIGISIETALNASYQFLSKEEARVFRHLVVFPGSWDASSEEYICEDHSHSALSQLVRFALVSFDKANARYRLHDLVRLYASGRPAQASDAVHELHCEYFTQLLVKAVPPNEKYDMKSKAFAKCKQEWGNIEKAQSWAAKNIETREKAAPMCFIHGVTADGFLLEDVMPFRKLIPWLDDGLRAARKLRNIPGQCKILHGLGIAYTFIGDSSSAYKAWEEAVQLATKNGLKRWEGRLLIAIANKRFLEGKEAQALPLAEQGATILNQLNDYLAHDANDLVQTLRRELYIPR